MKKIKTEVLVAGGGVAGCAAAISAARAGHKVILVEKMTICGGLATAGNVIFYLPICDGYGKKVISGLAEELLLASIKYGPGEINEDWKKSNARYMATFNPASFILVLDELLKEAGVEVWFDTVVTNIKKSDKKISSIECYNKSGLHQIEADCFIDATGDADLAVMSGTKYKTGKNRISCWTLEMQPDGKKLYINGGAGNPEDTKTGISGKIVSEYTLQSRESLLNSYKKKWDEDDNLNPLNYYPAILSTMPNFRMTRAIEGKSYLDDNNFWTDFDDSVGIFPATEMIWDKSKMWSIPFGALVPANVNNLLVAGRCIDSRGWAWDNTRLIPVAVQTGNIAGVAAGLSIKSKKSVHELSVKKLQKELSEQGHLLNFEETYGKNWKEVAKERLAEQKNKQANNNTNH